MTLDLSQSLAEAKTETVSTLKKWSTPTVEIHHVQDLTMAGTNGANDGGAFSS